MLYDSNVEKQNKTVCGQEEPHNMKQEMQVGECQSVQTETFTTYQNKKVRVVLEFPKQSDPQAEAEFISRLKEIYLRKIEIGAMQEKESALSSHPGVNSEEKNNKPFCGSKHKGE